jgi:PhzF family phenazine biosynthesis protein
MKTKNNHFAMNNIPFFLIDTFTKERFKGNPTSVFVLNKILSDETLQQIAAECNMPVTAFVQITETTASIYAIRYFTAITEIAACGHATLAAAKVISLLKNSYSFQFKTTEEKLLPAEISNDTIILTYPKYTTVPFAINKQLTDALSLQSFYAIGYCKELETVFIEIPDAELLWKLQPDFEKLLEIEGMKEVVVTSASDNNQYDYLLRSFCPWIGIDEDPVTGSVHSVLAGYWSERLNKNELKAYQASERSGELFVRTLNNSVELGGNVVMVMKGELLL